MRKLGLALAVGVLAAGTVAHAQVAGGISNIQSSASTTANVSGNDPFTFIQGIDPVAGVVAGSPGPSAANYNSFVNVNPSTITFESGNGGTIQNTLSQSQVSFKVTNNTGNAATFNSTITAAGLGFYLADTSGGCLPSACAQVAPGGATFASLPGTGTLAQVGFTFQIQSQALNSDGFAVGDPTTLKTLSGSLSIGHDGTPLFVSDGLGGPALFCETLACPPTGPRGLLNNFRSTLGDDYTGDANAATAIGYAWDATDISFGIGSGQFQVLTYTTTVTSESDTDCVGSVCLIAYSGFGDPVGASGAVDNAIGALGRFNFSGGGGCTPGLICGLNFSPTTFNVPTFDGSTGSFGTAGVPEPATWTMMIAGFGLLGAALRRRRVVAYN